MTQLELDFNSPLPERPNHIIVIDFDRYINDLEPDHFVLSENKKVISTLSSIKWDFNAVVRHAITQPILDNQGYEQDSYIKDDFRFINFTANLAAFDVSDGGEPISMSKEDWGSLYCDLNDWLAAGCWYDVLPQVHSHIEILWLVYNVLTDILDRR